MKPEEVGLIRLVGKVKTVQIDRADITEVSGSIVEVNREPEQIITLSDKGAVTEITTFLQGISTLRIVNNYDAHGKLTESFTEENGVSSATSYFYDKAGKLIMYIHCDQNKELEEKANYSYTADGKLAGIVYFGRNDQVKRRLNHAYEATGARVTKTYVYDEEGKCYLDSVLAYDGNDGLIESVSYNTDSLQVSRRTRMYDFDGKCTKQIWYDHDGKVSAEYVWEYDGSGTPISEVKFSPDGSKIDEYSINTEFDDIGNWIKKTHMRVFPSDRMSHQYLGMVSYRSITYWE